MVDKPIFEFLGGTGGHPEKQTKPGIPINLVNAQTRGHYLLSGPEKAAGEEDAANQYANLNFTGLPGTASGLYYSLVFEMGRLGFKVNKADEWIEVSPTHRAYWEKTTATKQMLEGVIKQGLASAAALVSDHELAKHDIRKYEEILKYFAAPPGKQHSLRAMFVDNVDAHTDLPGGGAISLRTSVQRWPTLIADFMKLDDNDTEPDAIAKKYNLSKAESVILTTKNRLFLEWKSMFKGAAKDRYVTLTAMVRSREKSITEYKEWLRPYIARYKLTKTGGTKAGTLRSFADIAGQATFFNFIRIFAWKPMQPTEPRRAPSEVVKGPHAQAWWIYPYDDWMRYNYVLNSKRGLAAIYPWLMEEKKYCSSCKKYYPANKVRCDDCGGFGLENRFYGDQVMENEVLAKWKSFGFNPEDLYYYFIDMKVERAGSSLPIGEIEDITFSMKGHVASQNVMAVKALELKCREIELEHYIDEMLGYKSEQKDISDIVKEKLPEIFDEKKEVTPTEKLGEEIEKISKILGLKGDRKGPATPSKSLMLLKPGQYERDMEERITKQYLSPAGGQFGTVVGFLKSKMGVR
ncbi:MAG: hypothetical protein GOV02_03420 [Candidatus Aenigmarchaeota archaeon]|nr:hypothetical protein [Candidatus Aenigmarchaeota archaeon]